MNDARATLVDVQITRWEAEILFRYWFRRSLVFNDLCTIGGQPGSPEAREILYSRYRLDALEAHVSGEFLDEIKEEAEERDKDVPDGLIEGGDDWMDGPMSED